MNDQIRAIKSLEVDDIKIYEARDGKLSALTRGKLEILYLGEFDRFVLRLNTFKYTLSVKLPIMASLFEEGAFRSYVLPNVGGNYILKLKSAPNPVVLRNLETIFSNYSQFSYQQNQIHDLENQAHRRGDYPLTFGTLLEETHRQHEASNQSDVIAKTTSYLRVGGEILRQNIMRAANYIGKNLMHHKEVGAANQASNQLSIKPIEELKGMTGSHVQFIDLPKYEVTALITLGNEIEKLVLAQAEQNKGLHIHPPSNRNFTALKRSAMESAQCLWSNMDEALTTLSHSIKAKKAKGSDTEDKKFTIFKKAKQNEGLLPMQQVSQQPDTDYAQSMDRPEVGHYTESSNSAISTLSSKSSQNQSEANRQPKLRGEARGQAQTNYAIQDRQTQYSDATEA